MGLFLCSFEERPLLDHSWPLPQRWQHPDWTWGEDFLSGKVGHNHAASRAGHFHANPTTLSLRQVEATPPEELMFSWLKNGRALRSSERMVITQTDPDISPGTTNLDIIDLKFTDFGTYTCVAALKGGGIPEISIDVNISSTTGESHTPVCHWNLPEAPLHGL